jgi:AcrR family transcriptional regulator
VLDSTIKTTESGPRERRHEQTRREIIEAAWGLAEVNGIAGLSFREVARAVGMQAPSLYTYFDSKDALFDAMFAEGYVQIGDAVVGWVADSEGQEPGEALGSVVAHWIRFCQSSLARYQIMFTRALPNWQPSEDAYAVSVREYQKMTESLAAIGITSNEDLDLFTAIASGLAAQQLANDPTGDRWVRLSDAAARMLIDDINRRNT